MKRAAVAACAIAATVSLSTVPDARAQTPPSTTSSTENRALAETLFFTARGLMEAGRYAEACVKLAESYRLDAAAGTLLNLAVCHQKIDKIASAWGEFREALADAKKAGRADREELATKAIAALEPDLPWLSIEVPASVRVPGLEVRRNGLPLSAAAWATELPVDPGEVEIVARAPAYKPKTQKVQIAKKQHLTVTLEKLDLAPVQAPPEPDGWTGKRKAGFAIGLFGLASIGAGAVFGVSALSKRKNSDDACPVFDGDRRCTSAGVDAMSQARTFSWLSDVGFGLGAIAVGLGTYFFVTGGRHDAPAESAHTPVAWRAWVNVANGGAQGFVGSSF